MNSTNKIPDLIKKRRKEKKLTLEKLGELCGVGASTVRKWEVGMISNIKRENIAKLCNALDLSPTDFLDLELSVKDQNISVNDKYLTIYGRVCAGDGFEAFEDAVDKIANPYFDVKGELFGLQVVGDSMNNVVNDGMYAIIRKQSTVNNGEIAVVMIDGDIGMLKRFYQVDDMIILRPDSTNPDYKPITIVADELNDLRILGRYIGCVSPMEELMEN